MTEPAQPAEPQQSGTRRLAISLLVIAFIGAGFAATRMMNTQPDAQQLLKEALQEHARGNTDKAETLARQLLQIEPDSSGAMLLAAEGAIGRNDYETAVKDLTSVSESEPNIWLESRRLLAEAFHLHLFRYADAENAYKQILKIEPNDVAANEGYAQLLGLCGRRREAIPHVLRLIKAGIDSDLLILIARESGLIADVESLQAARKADPDDPNPLLGLAAIAHAQENHAEALQLVEQAKDLNGLPNSFDGRHGKLLLLNQQLDQLDDWRTSLDLASPGFESWVTLAQLAVRNDDPKGAIRCYWEAARINPDSQQVCFQLGRLLKAAEKHKQAAPFAARSQQLSELATLQQRSILSRQAPGFEELLGLIKGYGELGRLWEVIAWGRIATEMQPQNAELLKVVDPAIQQLESLPMSLTANEFNPALQVDLSSYPLPRFESVSMNDIDAVTSNDISFKQQAADVGFQFRYFNGSEKPTNRMFEFSGGGIATIDFNNDDYPDLFCTQGYNWGQKPKPDQLDALFQNRNGKSFTNISKLAFPSEAEFENGFGQGVSAGDFDNDGFIDLYVANTSENVLWHNNGDGTFSKVDVATDQQHLWTTSCLIADLNGDSIPDLYDVNYVSGDDVFDRICVSEQNDDTMCSPYDFDPAMDCVWIGDGLGGFRNATEAFLAQPPIGKGLGVCAFDKGDGRLSLFISNDTTANFFYTADSKSSATLEEIGVTSGLAFNEDGKAQACMGIAAGDCNQDGRMDLLVTNFLYESNTLYSQLSDNLFDDLTRESNLHEATLPVLGFGTQFLDANLDGRLELFVTNGYTQDVSRHGTPYQMKPQLFEWTGKSFTELLSDSVGEWTQEESVGRAAARLDWNRDFKPDLVVGRLDRESFLLTNVSTVTDKTAISIKLISTESARDAIGTQVTISIGQSTQTHQLTAGDGYQCSNERKIFIGCGPARQVDRLTVRWPSGEVQDFANVPTGNAITIVEGRNCLLNN